MQNQKILFHNEGFYVTNKNVISYIHEEKSKEINITLTGFSKKPILHERLYCDYNRIKHLFD